MGNSLALGAHMRFLDGVPVTSYCESSGTWHLDEIDLLNLALQTNGAIAFTPAVDDVESVGLGPALAAKWGLPFVASNYKAFDQVYGNSIHCIKIQPTETGAALAGEQLNDCLRRLRSKDKEWMAWLAHNQSVIAKRFPDLPWEDLLRRLASDV